jgi:hypothetical protein
MKPNENANGNGRRPMDPHGAVQHGSDVGDLSFAVVEVTPAQAKKWLAHNDDNNRAISEQRVSVLAGAMSSGNWRVTHQGICFNGEGTLIEQHFDSAEESNVR